MAVACRVCRGTDLEIVLDLGDQPHCNSLLTPAQLAEAEPRYPLRLYFCHGCTTVQIDHTVAKETMFADYLYVSGTTETLSEHFRQSALRLTHRLGLEPGDLVVDIGSNDGTWLKHFQALGLDVLGVEPARNVAAMAESAGVPTMVRFFDASVAREITVRVGQPKLVTAAGVFFHLEELHSATEGIAGLCRSGAVFCVQAIYLAEMLRQNAFDNVYHEHLTYWTLGSIQRLFDQYGLEVFSADVLPIHGGSLALLVAAKGTRPVEASVARLRERERRERLAEVETYHAFADRVWRIRDGLVELIGKLGDHGRLVHALGAPAKGATLLNSFGISTDLIACAEERNPLKVGRFIPGARIPIVEEGSVPEPDAYVVLPWNFLGEFLFKKRAYFERGGSFIVPIPAPRLINAATYDAWLGGRDD